MDETDQRSTDLASRVASLEAYSKIQAVNSRDLRYEVSEIRTIVGEIRQDIHGAKIAGRVGIGIAMVLGGIIAWVSQLVIRG